jgi:hypothetical protein
VAARVNGEFCQSAGSCVLASYAIVANYSTGQPVATYFEGYCQHFGLTFTNALDAEKKYAVHFDHEWRKRDCRGYEVILDLHQHSTVKCFVEARKRFSGHFYLDSDAHLKELESMLACQPASARMPQEAPAPSQPPVQTVGGKPDAEPQQIPARMLNEFVYCRRLFAARGMTRTESRGTLVASQVRHGDGKIHSPVGERS